MEKRLKHVSKEKDCLTISKGNTRPSSISSSKSSESIPTDLIIEICLRLPIKSISRFRCVSKDLASILIHPDFTDLFLTMSSSRLRLLFSFKTNGKWFFYSAPQPLNPDQNSSPLAAEYHMCFPCPPYIFPPVCGLLFNSNIRLEPGENAMIYNPSTGQSITLPKAKIRSVNVKTFFGYDPINKQHKVLCMSVCSESRKAADEHQVLTLGMEKPSWKMIECSLPHLPMSSGICINGVLYYSAVKVEFPRTKIIVCFDLRFEKFKFTEVVDNNGTYVQLLINYAGKLGLILNHTCLFSRYTTRLVLWVLDDVEGNKWSQHIKVLPPLWKNLVADTILCISGMTGNGEIVFSPGVLSDPFYIFFYNVEKNTIVRVRIQGIESTTPQVRISTFIDHVENVKRM